MLTNIKGEIMKNYLWSSILIFLLSSTAFAATTQNVQYFGQEEDFLKLNTILSETRYRDREVDTTCNRQVPYQEQVCGNETRYRQECRQQAGQNVCSTTYERVCRNVSRTRRECTSQPGRQVCRTTRPTQICRNGRCRTEPARRICEDGPSRQVCRNVPYNDRVCEQQPRQTCNWVPGRNVCSDVPYSEYICRNVTRYRNETYACRRIIQEPYNVEKTVDATFDVKYKGANQNADSLLIFKLENNGEVSLKADDQSQRGKIITLKKNLETNENTRSIKTSGNLVVRFFNKEKFMEPVRHGIQSVGLYNSHAFFSIGKITESERLKIKLKISDSSNTVFDKVLSVDDFSLTDRETMSRLQIDLRDHGVFLSDRNYNVSIDVSLDFGNEIVNLSKDDLSTSASFNIRP